MTYHLPCRRSLVFPALTAVLALAAQAQSVISTHAGVIHFFDGAVYLGDRPLESHLGKFLSVPQGADLRTEAGRAEVLLTPGVFLRMGERSAIHMLANDLADTQVELRNGSVIVESGEPNPDTSVTVIYQDWRVHFLRQGVYRIDSDPPRLWVHQGEAEVSAGANGTPVSVEQGTDLPFAGVLVPEQSSELSRDALTDWANGRSESIAADNAITAQIDEDPASRTPDLDGFTYFPLLGVSSLGPAFYGSYGAVAPYQPGFSSIYLPGYAYRPSIIGLMRPGLRSYQPGLIRPIGVSPGLGASPGIGTIVSGPRFPMPRPPVVRAAPPVVTPRVGVRAGVHR